MGLMIQSKKAIFFTLSGILLIMFLLSYLGVQLSTDSFTTLGTNNRLMVVDEFLDSIYSDGEFALQTASFRSFLAMTDYSSTTGLYIDDVEIRLTEALTYETINSDSFTILDNNSMDYWAGKMILFANDFLLQMNITFGEVTVSQNDPWFIDITYETNITLFDQLSGASWNESRVLTTQVSIEGIYDPLYIIETNNQFVIYFEQTPYNTFVKGTNITNLSNHISGQYYTQFNGAPSFLSRFTGDSTPGGSNGIESLVDKEELELAIPVDIDRSNVDYLYFSSFNVTVYDFTTAPADFRLDNESQTNQAHITHYNLTHLLT